MVLYKPIYSEGTDTGIENGHVNTDGEGEDRMDWESIIVIYTPQRVK